MRKNVTQLFVCMMLLAQCVFAQQRQIRGTVTSGGEPVPFASVMVKGTTIGVAANVNGNFELNVPMDAKTLVVSSVGYKGKELNIESGTTFNVELEEDVLNMEQVVVTANAIEREKRSLGYATTQIESDEVTKGRDRSVLNALQGKVAGVNITNGSGSVGSSTRIVIRGGSSISGNNQALIVVDGIPIDNSSFQTGDNLNNQVDFGNRANDINPEDIESITVLKGPAASALYGSRASNGAILITTKKGMSGTGKTKKQEISYTTSYTFEDILRLPEFQNEFGQGGEGKPDPRENFSWGPKFDGQMRPWGQSIMDENGKMKQRVKPYVALPDNVKEFFDIGHSWTNTLSLGGGNEVASYYASFSNLDNTGVIPGTTYDRQTVKVSGETQLNNRFSSSASINYFKTKSMNSTQGQSFSVYDQILQTPRDIPILEAKDLDDPFNQSNTYYAGYTLNPYWILENSSNRGDVDRVLGNMQLNYRANDWLDFTGRAGTDFYTDSRKYSRLKYQFTNWGFDQEDIGRYAEDVYRVSEITTDLMANIHRDLSQDLKLNVLLGHNVRQRKAELTSASTAGLIIPNYYNLANSDGPVVAANEIAQRRLYGLYTDINFGFKNMFFLGFTARNDWSSTLPKDNNSFFYPGVNAAFVFSDALKLENKNILSYGKLRAGWASVGNDADPYLLTTVFIPGSVDDGHANTDLNFPLNGVPGYERGNRIGNAKLKPEITTALEVGTEMSFLDNRLGVDFTWYDNTSKDQILAVPIAPSSGFNSQTINAGEINNTGIELLLRGSPLRSKKKDGFKWDLTFTYTKNKSNVVSLYAGVDQVVLGAPGQAGISGASVVAAVGKPYGTWYVLGPRMDPDGHVIVDSTSGMPQMDSKPQYFGTYQPDYIMGISSEMRFKGVKFSFTLDHHQGGTMYSRTKDIQEFVGSSPNTLNNNREDFVVENSVIEVTPPEYNDKGEITKAGVYKTNTDVKVHHQDYWTDQSDFSANLIDASFTKLREVTLSYSLPESIVNKTFFGNIEVGVFGRNVALWTPEKNTFVDPEVSSMGNGNAQGFEYGAIPPIKTWGGQLRVTF
jgi:TonB-linked SusC/RagA family outer membrane protein